MDQKIDDLLRLPDKKKQGVREKRLKTLKKTNTKTSLQIELSKGLSWELMQKPTGKKYRLPVGNLLVSRYKNKTDTH